MKALYIEKTTPFLKEGEYYIIQSERGDEYLIMLGQGVWQHFPKSFFKRLDELRKDKLFRLGIK